jgi:hypothetical protein
MGHCSIVSGQIEVEQIAGEIPKRRSAHHQDCLSDVAKRRALGPLPQSPLAPSAKSPIRHRIEAGLGAPGRKAFAQQIGIGLISNWAQR